METVALKVNKILKVTGAWAHVTINSAAFNAIKGFSPAMAYTTSRNRDGKGVRVFDFNGTKVYTCFEPSKAEGEFGKAKILMLNTDAQAIRAEMDNEEVLEFGEDAFAVQA